MKSFSLKNFKSFAGEQIIPLKPITLIYGANSAGKSSLIQGYVLLNHIMKTGTCNPQIIETSWDHLDLGGFAQYSYKHKYNNETNIVVNLKENIQLELTLKAQTNDFSQIVGNNAYLSGLHISVNKEPIVKLSKVSPDTNIKYRISGLNTEHEKWKSYNKEALIIEEKDMRNLQFDLYKYINGHTSKNFDENLSKECFKLPETPLPIHKKVKEYLSILIDQIWKPVWQPNTSDITNENRLDITYIGPLRDYPPRVISNDLRSDDLKDHTWSILLRDSSVREKVNKWFSNSELMNPTYRFEVQKKLDPVEMLLPLLEIYQEVDLTSGHIPDELKSIASIEMDGDREGPAEAYLSFDNYSEEGATELINNILSNSDENATYKKLNLIDERSNISVSLRDVGVGISQVLPVLVNAYSKDNRVAAIEQPEIHLHPKLQSELADVFIETALGEEKKTFLIETHSEHLLLRIMRRIRESTNGNLPNGMQYIEAKDVQILFVMPSQNGEGSIIKKIALDEEGEMIDNWPGGFFEEGFNERFGL